MVLSYGLWQLRFGGDPAIAGKSISPGNEPYTVVGVVGKGLVGHVQADLWLPFQIDPASSDGNVSFYVTALLQPGVTVAQANAQLQVAWNSKCRCLIPQNANAKLAVTTKSGETLTGTLSYKDEFHIAVTDSAGSSSWLIRAIDCRVDSLSRSY